MRSGTALQATVLHMQSIVGTGTGRTVIQCSCAHGPQFWWFTNLHTLTVALAELRAHELRARRQQVAVLCRPVLVCQE